MDEKCKEHSDELKSVGKRIGSVENTIHEHNAKIDTHEKAIDKLDVDIWKAIDNLRRDHTLMMKEVNDSMNKILVKLGWVFGVMFGVSQIATLAVLIYTKGN